MSDKKNKGWSNLRPGGFKDIDKDELRAISKKGQEKSLEVRRQKKTAKECLDSVLSLEVTDEIIAGAELPEELKEQLIAKNPHVTMYELIQLVSVGLAVGGDLKAVEYVRDTYGDKPTNKVAVSTDDIMTDADRALMQQIQERLEGGHLVVVKDVTEDNHHDEN